MDFICKVDKLGKNKKLREKEKVLSKHCTFGAHELFVNEGNRQLSSKWTIQVQVKISMHLPDGRILMVDEIRNLPAKQIGRKQKKNISI